MKRRPEWAVLALWTITTVTVLMVIGESGRFTILGPVYFIGMIGSIRLLTKPHAELAILTLWAIALAATLAIVQSADLFTVLAPVYAVCMIGSMVTVRSARNRMLYSG